MMLRLIFSDCLNPPMVQHFVKSANIKQCDNILKYDIVSAYLSTFTFANTFIPRSEILFRYKNTTKLYLYLLTIFYLDCLI